MTGPGFCTAVTQPGTVATVYLGGVTAAEVLRAGEVLICTRDAGHPGSHWACDGHGRVLARWPRRPAEQFWQPSDCQGHGHG